MPKQKSLVNINPNVPASQHWKILEPLYTEVRRRLTSDPSWRMGPLRVKEVARQAFDHLSKYSPVEDQVYFDLGCGKEHPFGSSAIMFLNGARGCIGIDMDQLDEVRVAEALFDLLVECLAEPENWLWSGIDKPTFLSRINLFNLSALKKGQLIKGLEKVPLYYQRASLSSCNISPGEVNLMSSRAVLEHIMDFPSAMDNMYNLLAPGGVAYHVVDLIDHRYYGDKNTFHYWSFLGEPEEWTGSSCNRLRAHEIEQQLKNAGFEILAFEPTKENLPPGFRDKLAGRFAKMSDEELEVVGATWIIKKPE